MKHSFTTIFIERSRKSVADVVTVCPDLDITELPGGYCLYCNLPGVRQEDIVLGIDEGVLSLKAEAGLAPLPGRIHALEFSDILFEANIRLPMHVDLEKVSAEFVNGLLLVSLPFPEKRTVRITINAG